MVDCEDSYCSRWAALRPLDPRQVELRQDSCLVQLQIHSQFCASPANSLTSTHHQHIRMELATAMNTTVTVETVHGLKDIFVVGPSGTVDTCQQIVKVEDDSADDSSSKQAEPVRRKTK